MSEISKICQGQGIKISPTSDFAQADVSDIETIQNILLFVGALKVANDTLNEIIKISYSEETQGIYASFSAIAKKEPTAIKRGISALESTKENIENTLKQTTLDSNRRIALTEDYKRISSALEALNKLKEALGKIDSSATKEAKDLYSDKEKDSKEASQLKKIIDALKQSINEQAEGLSSSVKTKLGVVKDKFADKALDKDFTDKANEFIKDRCENGQIIKEPKGKVPPPPPKPQPGPFEPHFVYSLRAGSGYGDGASSSEDRGVLARTGASARYEFSPKFFLQADYNFAANYGGGDDKVVSNNDYGRVSGVVHTDSVDASIRAGWRYYRNDYPSKFTMDQNILVQAMRLNFKFGKFSVNLDENLAYGKTNTAFPPQSSDFHLAGVSAEPGISYSAGAVTPFAGGIAGKNDDGTYFGGYGGLGIKASKHEVDLRGQYTTNKDLGVFGRYYFDADRFGFGLSGYLLMNSDSQRMIAGGGLFGQVKLGKVMGQEISIRPYGNAGIEKNGDDSTVNWSAGLSLWMGDLLSADPSNLRPYSINPVFGVY